MNERRIKMTTMAVNQRFQNGAQDYVAYLETPEGRLRSDLAFANLEDFLPRSQAEKSLRALDLGCGTGATGVRLARLGIHVTLLDSSPAMLDIAQRAAREAGVTEKIVLKYVDHPSAVLSAAAQVMRCDSTGIGILSILVRNWAGEVFKAGIQEGDLGAAEHNLTAEWGHESLYGSRVRLFTADSLRTMLKVASLGVTAERGVRIISDYLPPQVSRSAEYERIFELERKLGSRPEFVAVARYTQYLARCAGPVTEDPA